MRPVTRLPLRRAARLLAALVLLVPAAHAARAQGRAAAGGPGAAAGGPGAAAGGPRAATVRAPAGAAQRPAARAPADADWPTYGGDPGGARFSPLTRIDRSNVARLKVAWTYHTGDVSDGKVHPSPSSFEATPILAFGTLYLSTPFDRVIALDPATGRERWTYDPRIDLGVEYSESLVSRGVAAWQDPAAPASAACRRRIFLGTLDARLIALDAATGKPCADFGDGGTVDLVADGVGRIQRGQYEVTSPPAVVAGVVVVGSGIGDNRAVWNERGTVRGFDARSGRLRWAWDPIPRRPEQPGWAGADPRDRRLTGAANAWSILSVDTARGWVLVPTGSASPDFYGGVRRGNIDYADAVVALEGATGRPVWHFQVVHHNLWDYDVPAEPAQGTLRLDGRDVPIVVQGTKMGEVFVLDRRTGKPVFGVEERPVPPSDVAGETASPTQPFAVRPAPLLPARITAADAWGPTPADQAACRAWMDTLRSDGLFTPPSLRGTLVYPGFIGGVSWGGVAVDSRGATGVFALNRFAFWVRLVPRDSAHAWWMARRPRTEYAEQAGTPYAMMRGPLLGPSGAPCTSPPFGELVAVDLRTGAVRWHVPLGTIPGLAALPGSERWGSITLGGPIVTAGGLAFVGATMDPFIRAFDLATGAELWRAELPAAAQATPMTYAVGGKQYVVIAAGGHGKMGTKLGDAVVAFTLP